MFKSRKIPFEDLGLHSDDIEKLKRIYWEVVFAVGSEEEVAKWDIDKLLEAYAALKIIEEEKEEKDQEGEGING